MNSFAGIIGQSTNADAANLWIDKLGRDFPTHFKAAVRYEDGALCMAGRHFTASALNAPGSTRLYFDGELFNTKELSDYSGQSAADAASLIHQLILASGLEAVGKINGQFLIVYVDEAARKIYLINDHSGIQQVFYHQADGFLLFASEIKFLLAHPACPAELDWESSLRRPTPVQILSSYINYRTWFKRIELMPEANICAVNTEDGKAALTAYWDALNTVKPDAADKRTAEEVMEEYMTLLEDAVRIRAEDSETAHSFLSGGLDSSAICALAAKHRPVDSYSIITQTTCFEDTTAVCHDLAGELHFNNVQFMVPYHEINFDKQLWKQRVWRAESPVNHTDSLTKTMLHYAIAQKNAAVEYVLTGTGSDQYNGGLARYIVNDEDTYAASAASLMRAVKDAETGKLIHRDDTELWKRRHFIRRDYLAGIAGEQIEENTWIYYIKSALHGETYSLLWDEVRAASAHGHSVRFPFLDYRFAEFFAAIPARLNETLFYDKRILREPAKKILPDYVLNKPKAPPYRPEYDFRFKLFSYLTSGEDSLLEEAFGAEDEPHPVIDKKHLYARIAALKQQPEIMEWLDVMHLINLGLLEKMAGKTEANMAYEAAIAPQEISFTDPAAAKTYLERRLAIKTKEAWMHEPLAFAEGCSLVEDKRTGALYLSKKNALAYELYEEYADWRAFLYSIDGERSACQILAAQNIPLEAVEEFLLLAAQEQILQTVPNLQPA